MKKQEVKKCSKCGQTGEMEIELIYKNEDLVVIIIKCLLCGTVLCWPLGRSVAERYYFGQDGSVVK